MRKLFLALLLAFIFLPNVAKAVEFDVNKIRPAIAGDSIVRVNRNIIFDASSSFLLDTGESVTYEWKMGDGTTIYGEEAVHTYAKAGSYTVTLSITQGNQKESIAREVFAYNKLIFLLTDVAERKENVENLKQDAAEEGIFVFVIQSYETTTAFMSEETLYKQLNDNLSGLINADAVAIWTTRGSGINAMTRLVQQESGKDESSLQDALSNKTILVITEENIGTLGRIMQGNFNIIKPKQIIITRQYELKNFIIAATDAKFVEDLEKSVSDYSLINAETGRISVWNSISYLVSFMISKGIPSNTIVLLLMLPIIATIIAFLKQVVGITTFGLYTPSIITLSFLALGLKFGLAILFIIIISGAFVRTLLDRFHLLHIPRIAIVLTFSTLIILLTLALGTYLGVTAIASIAVFPMLIMTTLAEKFVSALGGKGFYAAFLLMLETTVVSLICYWVVEWHYLQNLILGHPEIILLLIIFNYGLGRWTGLRLMEYVRFREVMKHAEE
ncbi:PKD domain-containing protein [Candidatus Peregrinibacteria bacterium]|nr:PKD domain-containing protein [Candidatus Peregrinibacteria bacterium]